MSPEKSFNLAKFESDPPLNIKANYLLLNHQGFKVEITSYPWGFSILADGQKPRISKKEFFALYYHPDIGLGQWEYSDLEEPLEDDGMVILNQSAELRVGNNVLSPLLVVGKAEKGSDALALYVSEEIEVDIAVTFLRKGKTNILFKKRRPPDSVDDWGQIGFDPDAAGEPPSGSIWLEQQREGKEFPIKNKII